MLYATVEHTPMPDHAKVAPAAARAVGAITPQILADLKTYPPQVFSARRRKMYQRTGQLGAGWQVSTIANVDNAFGTTLENDVEYAGYVQGGPEDEPQQAQQNRHWQTTQAIATRYEMGLAEKIDSEISAALNEGGLEL